MATLREYTSKSGQTTFKVLFRHAGKQSSRSFDTELAARRFMLRSELDGWDEAIAALKPEKPTSLTLDEVAEKWLAARQVDVDAGSLTPRVLTGYRRDYENWVSPYLGHKGAEQIDEMAVQNWIDKIKVAPRSSAKSVSGRHAILHQIFKWASSPRRKIIAVGHNPCVGTELPERTRKPPKGLRLPEQQALQEAARATYPDAADLIDFIIGTGWRIGEAIALTVGQVEDDDQEVYVSMSRVWRREVGFIEDAKSEAGLRRLRVLGDAVAVLRRRAQGKQPGDLVFTTEKGLPWDESGFRRDYWKKIVTTAGLGGGYKCECGAQPTSTKRVESHERATGHTVTKIEGRNPTPHWLRHSHVFVCHAAGMDIAEIQRRLGHKDIQMTINIYGRLIDGMNDEVAARLEALLTTPKTPAVVQGSVAKGELAE